MRTCLCGAVHLEVRPRASCYAAIRVLTMDDDSCADDYIESEDSEDEDGAQSTRSTSVATTGTAGRPLTARQAVLANVVDSSHVSLGV